MHYSPEPAQYSTVVEVYRELLAEFAEKPWPGSVTLQHFGQVQPRADRWTCDVTVPDHWADTLKREVRVALSNLTCSMLADSVEFARAAQTLGLALLPVDTTDLPSSKRHPPPMVQLSRPGFNGDSTIAVVRMDVHCGPVCGSGETLLLARRQGKRWKIWHQFLHWVS